MLPSPYLPSTVTVTRSLVRYFCILCTCNFFIVSKISTLIIRTGTSNVYIFNTAFFVINILLLASVLFWLCYTSFKLDLLIPSPLMRFENNVDILNAEQNTILFKFADSMIYNSAPTAQLQREEIDWFWFE